MNAVIEKLRASDEPALLCKLAAYVLGWAESELAPYRQRVKDSVCVEALLSVRDADGKIPYGPCSKWYGAHWVLSALADLGYPANDDALRPLAILATAGRLEL